MTIDFAVDPEFEDKLAWIRAFVTEEIEPIDLALGGEHAIYDKTRPVHDAVIHPLQDRVRRTGALGVPSRPGTQMARVLCRVSELCGTPVPVSVVV
jgi:acyl-CoA dehydrogenase